MSRNWECPEIISNQIGYHSDNQSKTQKTSCNHDNRLVNKWLQVAQHQPKFREISEKQLRVAPALTRMRNNNLSVSLSRLALLHHTPLSVP